MPIVPITITAGESRVLTLTVTDEDTDALANLTGATIEFQAKEAPGAADPALIAKSTGAGITILSQAGATLGQAQVTLDTADTEDLGGRRLYYDVVLVLGGSRRYVIHPSPLTVRQPINLP